MTRLNVGLEIVLAGKLITAMFTPCGPEWLHFMNIKNVAIQAANTTELRTAKFTDTLLLVVQATNMTLQIILILELFATLLAHMLLAQGVHSFHVICQSRLPFVSPVAQFARVILLADVVLNTNMIIQHLRVLELLSTVLADPFWSLRRVLVDHVSAQVESVGKFLAAVRADNLLIEGVY